MGLDFAATLSSPDSFCVLLDITSEHSAELKWLMINKHKRWFHSSRVKFPWVNISASWFLVSVYLIWIIGPHWFDRTTNQEQLCESWKHVSLSGFFCLMIILITASFLHKHVQQSFLMRRVDVWGNKNQHCPNPWSFLLIVFVFELCEVANELHVCS